MSLPPEEVTQLLNEENREIFEQRLRAYIKGCYRPSWFTGKSFGYEYRAAAKVIIQTFLLAHHEGGMPNGHEFFGLQAGVMINGEKIVFEIDADEIARLSTVTCLRLMRSEREAVRKQQAMKIKFRNHSETTSPQVDELETRVRPSVAKRTSPAAIEGEDDGLNESARKKSQPAKPREVQEPQQPEQRELAILGCPERPYNLEGTTQLIQQWERHLEWTLNWYITQLEGIKAAASTNRTQVDNMVRFGSLTKQAFADLAASKASDASQTEKDKADYLEMMRK